MARTGLRMMPTFPSSPLRFRTAGFPQYGSKAGLSGDACPRCTPVKPAPGVPFANVVCLRPSRAPWPHPCLRSVSEGSARLRAAIQATQSLYPRGPRSSPGCSVPVHHRLFDPMRPTRRHSTISPSCRLIRAAFAVRERLGDPRVVPCFRCLLLPDMPSSLTPGSSSAVAPSSFTDDAGLRPFLKGSALPLLPPSASGGR